MGQRKRHVVIPLTFALIAVLALFLLTVPSKDVNEPPGYTYGIVLDAGSSHTTMYVYKWTVDKQNGTGVVTQHSECSPKGGGISSYVWQPGEAGRSLEECLDMAMKDIPRVRHHLTPVYLGATAGMRLLNISNPSASDRILGEVAEKIRSYPFDFQEAVILSGQQEGAYGWVTVNYLMEKFIKYGFIGRWQSANTETIGALDLGGASTQITFVTREAAEDRRNHMTLRLYGQDYNLYTHSFLCYGQGQMLLRLVASLMQFQGYNGTVVHPCYPVGYSVTMKLSEVFNSPCTSGFRPSQPNLDSTVTVVGTGQYELCLRNVTQLFSFDKCPFSHCSFDGTFQPKVKGMFVAFSAFYHAHRFLQRATGIKVTTPSQMDTAVRTLCAMSLSELKSKAPDEIKRLHEYCPSSAVVQILLLRGYSFDNTSFSQVSFESTARGAAVGWALGYMLILSNMVPAESMNLVKAIVPVAWGCLLFLMIVLLIVSLGYLLAQAFCGKKTTEDIL
ncbi:ectonucleoside triphosphate diphosphohydrolase 2-like [Brienomyrus brachyistius]|uniref:ectonucleoside triphosphate diphosphohydrolase 2-like n=1 Tax=Brienomyrus brachyistius TaxID=42636 RepID=UPI0020B26B4D|nr:ectonucleoside triphosphate diphosphohydrolase 2-like [Brienomyrus brachyistius]